MKSRTGILHYPYVDFSGKCRFWNCF